MRISLPWSLSLFRAVLTPDPEGPSWPSEYSPGRAWAAHFVGLGSGGAERWKEVVWLTFAGLELWDKHSTENLGRQAQRIP